MVRVIEEAAQFTARQRWAPKVELEHVLLALLVPGTDTYAYLAAREVDIPTLINELDAICPCYQNGPYFPTRSELWSHISIDIWDLNKDTSSDLKFVRAALSYLDDFPDGTPSFAQARLLELGITLEDIEAVLESI